MSRQTFAEAQGTAPTLYVDGTAVELEGLYDALSDEDGARVQVEWDAISSGYASDGWECSYCGHVEEDVDDARRHVEEDHGDEEDADTFLTRRAPLANSAAIDWTGDDLTVTISTGDPRGAFTMTVRRLEDGRRILHVPYPGESMPHESLVELQPGTYQIGG